MRSGLHGASQALHVVMDRAHEMLCSRKGAKSAKTMYVQNASDTCGMATMYWRELTSMAVIQRLPEVILR